MKQNGICGFVTRYNSPALRSRSDKLLQDTTIHPFMSTGTLREYNIKFFTFWYVLVPSPFLGLQDCQKPQPVTLVVELG